MLSRRYPYRGSRLDLASGGWSLGSTQLMPCAIGLAPGFAGSLRTVQLTELLPFVRNDDFSIYTGKLLTSCPRRIFTPCSFLRCPFMFSFRTAARTNLLLRT